ncbi:hypothetical protein ES705_50739 [subsurface metagenome]
MTMSNPPLTSSTSKKLRFQLKASISLPAFISSIFSSISDSSCSIAALWRSSSASSLLVFATKVRCAPTPFKSFSFFLRILSRCQMAISRLVLSMYFFSFSFSATVMAPAYLCFRSLYFPLNPMSFTCSSVFFTLPLSWVSRSNLKPQIFDTSVSTN